MLRPFGRLFSAVIIVVSVVGLAACGVGEVWLVRGYPAARTETLDVLEGVSVSVGALGGTLDAGARSLADASDALGAVGETLDAVDGSIETMDDTLAALDTLTGEQVPAVVADTVASLHTTQQSAAAIEQVLFALNAVSFLTGIDYAPEVTLEAQLGNVAESLAPIGDSMGTLNASLTDADEDLARLDAGLSDAADSLRAMQADLDAAEGSLAQAAEDAAVLHASLDALHERTAHGLTQLQRMAQITLLVAAVYQVGWLMLGLNAFRS